MTSAPPEAIAVVGLAGRFPGARDPAELWHLMTAGACSVSRRVDPSGRLQWARGVLDAVEDFDPDFFGMSPREALVLDPQQRLLLECAWQALADTGPGWRDERRLRRTAAFLGVNHSGYRELLCESGPSVSALEFESGTDKDFVATRIAYRLALQGPSMTVQTACSTSLVAVHLACQSLLEFEADQALAGGASIVLPSAVGWTYEPHTIHSADGVCRPFDADANGTVMGDGAGVVVLRRLEDAVADGCRIYAVIRGSAVNNDGARKVGFAAPSAAGQEEVIRAAHVHAGVAPSEIGYVETHGTGTPLGDRVELHALRNVFDGSGAPCVLGSVKGAIGHLDTAAGVVGLIRCCLALHHGVLPGTVNHVRPTADLEAGSTPFSVLGAATPWESATTRRAGVSSFGVGGTNAHVVVEEHRGSPSRGGDVQTLRDAGYRPRRFWPDGGPTGRAAPAELRTGVEHRRAVWREVACDDEPDRPPYAQVLLLGDRGVTSETLHRHVAASGIPTTWTGTVDAGLPEPPGRVLVVCTFALADAPDRRRHAYDALTTMARHWSGPHRSGPGFDVVVVTRAAFSPLGDERGDPALAALTGLARVLTMEVPSVRIRAVDVQDTSDQALALLAREALGWRAEPLVVQRGRRWWHLGWEPVTVSPGPGGPEDDDAVSVVVGTGQIGRSAARALVGGGRRVVLVARPGGADRAARLARELASGRGPVDVEECDAGDPDDVRALLGRLADRHGTIDLLVHAAGISGESAYQDSARLPCWRDEEHFRVKIDGIAALGDAVAHHRVRRVVLTSSLAGTLGALSLGPYSAAAAAMDAYADRFDGPGTRWLSVGWDAWWRPGAATAHEARMVGDGLTPEEADAAMTALLSSAASGRVVVTKGDFPARWDRFVRQPLRRAADAPVVVTGDGGRGPDAGDAPPDVLEMLLDGWRACLGEPSIGADDNLGDLGADSLTWIDVLTDIEPRIGLELPGDLFFEAATPRLLAERITEMLAGAGTDRSATEGLRTWGDGRMRVWCLHPIGGSADGFGELAAALGDCSVRAVAGVPLADVTAVESIESLADRYAGLLGGDAPPSVLVGWSFGAVVAFRLAQLVLAETGHAPAVVVVDMPAPGAPSTRSIVDVGDAEVLAAIVAHRARETGHPSGVAGWQQATDDGTFAAFVDRLRSDGLLPDGFTVDLGRRMAAGYRHRLAAVERYRPSPYPGPVVLLTAREAEFGGTALLDGVLPPPTGDPTWGWEPLSSGGVTVRVLDGHHVTLLQAPAVYDVAEVVHDLARRLHHA